MNPANHNEPERDLEDGSADEGADGTVTPDSANDGGADRGADDDPGESEADGAA